MAVLLGSTAAALQGQVPILLGGALGTPSSGALTNCTGLVEAGLTLADNTTADVSTTKHGLAPKLPNDATKFLNGVGAYSVPGGGGAWILLEQHAASASASLDFTTCISSAYDSYYFDIQGLILSGNNHLWWRAGTGAGPTYDSGANYSNDQFVWRAGGTGGAGGTGLTKVALTYLSSTPLASSTLVWSGHLTLSSPQSGSAFKNVEGRLIYSDTGFRVVNEFRGSYEAITVMTGCQFLPGAGTFTAGIIRAYGLAKS